MKSHLIIITVFAEYDYSNFILVSSIPCDFNILIYISDDNLNTLMLVNNHDIIIEVTTLISIELTQDLTPNRSK